MPRVPAVLIGAVLLSSTPHVLRADPVLGGAFCFPGAFQACASVSVVATEYFAEHPRLGGRAGTSVVVSMTNYQGWKGPATTAWGITWVYMLGLQGCQLDVDGGCGLEDPAWIELSGPASYVVEHEVVCVGEECAARSIGFDVISFGANGALATSQGSDYGMVVGCDLKADHQFDVRTCGGGSAEMTIDFAGQISLTDARIRVAGESDQGLFQCTIGEDCVTVTPEPASIALMASGLACIAGAYRRRRRRRN